MLRVAADLGAGFEDKGHSFEATPISWNGALYVSTSANQVLALDGVTGGILWRFDAQLDRNDDYSESTSRGVSFCHARYTLCNGPADVSIWSRLALRKATLGEISRR